MKSVFQTLLFVSNMEAHSRMPNIRDQKAGCPAIEKRMVAKNAELHCLKIDAIAPIGPTVNSKRKRDAARLAMRLLKKENATVQRNLHFQ